MGILRKGLRVEDQRETKNDGTAPEYNFQTYVAICSNLGRGCFWEQCRGGRGTGKDRD
jgi:hypothetical protein